MKISYTKGRTINTGNFQSVRIDIGLTLDCEPAEQEEAYERAKKWVDKKLALEKGDSDGTA